MKVHTFARFGGPGKLRVLGILGSLSLFAPLPVAPRGVGAAETLYVDGEVTSALARDRDGDGLAEIWISYHRDRQRFLGVFAGRVTYARAPDLIVPIDELAVFYMVGDFDAAPGLELALVSPTSAVLSPLDPGLEGRRARDGGSLGPGSGNGGNGGNAGNAGNGSPRRLFATDLFFPMPSRMALPSWMSRSCVDVDADGCPDIVIPEKERLRLRLKGKEVVLPVRHYLLSDSREERMRAAVEEVFRSEGLPSALLDLTGAYPFPVLVDFDGNGLLDVVVRQPGSLLEVFLQKEAGEFPSAPDRSVEIAWSRDATSVEIVDVDGDRRADLLASRLLLEDLATEISIYAQRPDEEDLGFARPLQSIKVAGFSRRPTVADIDGDGRLDIAVSTYRLDLLERAGRPSVDEIEISHEIFPGISEPGADDRPTGDPGKGGPPFARRPAFLERFRVRTQALEGGPPRPSIHAGQDLTGDGRPDILFLEGGNRLRLWRGLPGRGFRFEEDRAFARAVEDPRAVELVELDGLPGREVILRYDRRLEIVRAARRLTE